MTNRVYHNSVLLAVLSSIFVWGCADGFKSDELTRRYQKIRPTSPDSRIHYGEDTEVESFTEPTSEIKVWWAKSGVHSPPLTDSDGDDIPDYVEFVFETANKVRKHFRQAGFRVPLTDSEFLQEPDEYGGDAKFDIYLQNFEGADGHFATDACVRSASGQAAQCAGHIRLAKSFRNSHYSSVKEGIRVVVSHEYFHAIQAAYRAELPGWVSEGTATWSEEFFDASQSDFEGLADLYFEEPERSLNSPRYGPMDGWTYGASIFFYYLAQHLGPGTIIDLLENFADKQPVPEALANAAEVRDSTRADLLNTFFVWVAFTGDRSVDDFGFPDAERFGDMPVKNLDIDGAVNWNTSTDALTAKYARLSISNKLRIKAASVRDFERLSVSILPLEGPSSSESLMNVTESSTTLAPRDGPFLSVAANTDMEQSRAIQLQFRPVDTGSEEQPERDKGKAPEKGEKPKEPSPNKSSSESTSNGGCSQNTGLPNWFALFALSLFYLCPISTLWKPSATR